MDKDGIDMLFVEPVPATHGLLPGTHSLAAKIKRVKKEVLQNSLKNLVDDIQDVLVDVVKDKNNIKLSSVSVAVQFSAEGKVAMVASAGTMLSNSMVLTFDVER